LLRNFIDVKRSNKQKDIHIVTDQNKTQSAMQICNRRETNKIAKSCFDLKIGCSTLLDYRNYVAVRLVMVTRSIHTLSMSRRRCPGHHRRRVYIKFIDRGPRSLINLPARKSRSTTETTLLAEK